MHPIARFLAMAYVALAVFGAIVFVEETANYVNVADVQERLPASLEVVRIDLNWTGNTSDPAQFLVSINVTDPGNVAIKVIGTSFALHVDDPADGRPWYDATKLLGNLVATGGFSLTSAVGSAVPAGATRTVVTSLTVEPGPLMYVIDHPDANGRFHVVLLEPFITYVFADFDIEGTAYLPPYHDAAGVLPSGP